MEIIKFVNLTDSATTEAINKVFLNNGFLLTSRSNKYDSGNPFYFYHNYKLGNLYVGFEIFKNGIQNLKLCGNDGFEFWIKVVNNEIHIDIDNIINYVNKIRDRRNEKKIIRNVSNFKADIFKSWLEGSLSNVKENCFHSILDINNSSHTVGDLYNHTIRIINKPISKKIFSEIDFDDIKFSLEVGTKRFATNKPLKNIINILKNFKKLISEIEKTKQSYINDLIESNKKIEELKQQMSKRMSERDKEIINIINDYSNKS